MERPVLHMPDGGIEEDFPHITNTIDALLRETAIAPVLAPRVRQLAVEERMENGAFLARA